jgi:hypothetical protein
VPTGFRRIILGLPPFIEIHKAIILSRYEKAPLLFFTFGNIPFFPLVPWAILIYYQFY